MMDGVLEVKKEGFLKMVGHNSQIPDGRNNLFTVKYYLLIFFKTNLETLKNIHFIPT